MELIEKRRAKGLPVPVPVRPELPSWLVEFWQAFWLINRPRQYAGMSGTPMPLTLEGIKTYTEIYGTTNIDEFVELIFSMDNTYLEHQHKRLEKEQQTPEKRESRIVNGRHNRSDSP